MITAQEIEEKKDNLQSLSRGKGAPDKNLPPVIRFGGVVLNWPQVLFLAGMLAVLLALAAPLYTLGRYMFGVDYYQHFPLLIVAAAGLGFFRVRSRPPEFKGVFTWRVLAFSLLSIVLVAGVFIIPSRWVGALALLAWIVGIVNFLGGRQLATLLLGPFLLLAAALPLPVHFDNWFVVALQNLATRLASIWLDLAGVMHFTTGVSIQTAEHNYYVKDACSGIHSVFAAVAVGMGYAVIRDYRLLRVAVFQAQLLCWVVIANGMRVFLTIYLQFRYGIDLVEGAYHEMLGMVTFAVGVILAISGDRFLTYVFPIESAGLEGDKRRQRMSRIRENRFLDAVVTPRIAVVLLACIFLFGTVSAASFFRYQAPRTTPLTREQLVGTAYLDVLRAERELAPESVGDQWSLTNFIREDRDERSLFGGLVSLVWEYTNTSGRRVLISLDGAYDNWHDLSVCYSGAGWSIEGMQTIEIVRQGEPFYACELALSRDPIDVGQVIYVCVDPGGNDVKPPAYYGNAFMSLAKRFGLGTQDRESYAGGVIQIQLLDERPGTISDEQEGENRQLFWAVVDSILERSQG